MNDAGSLAASVSNFYIYQCHCDQNANNGAGGAIPDSLWAVEYSLSLSPEPGI